MSDTEYSTFSYWWGGLTHVWNKCLLFNIKILDESVDNNIKTINVAVFVIKMQIEMFQDQNNKMYNKTLIDYILGQIKPPLHGWNIADTE